jgi:hypothetical protein
LGVGVVGAGGWPPPPNPQPPNPQSPIPNPQSPFYLISLKLEFIINKINYFLFKFNIKGNEILIKIYKNSYGRSRKIEN